MNLRRSSAVAKRLLRQIRRDRRAVALVVVVPVVVMALLSVVLAKDDTPPLLVLDTPGTLDLFRRDMAAGLERVEDPDDRLEVTTLPNGADPDEALRRREIDAILRFSPTFLEDRVEGKTSYVELHIEGADPMRAAEIGARLQASLSLALERMPRLLPADCQAHCGDTIPVALPEVETRRLYGDGLDEAIDFYTPVLPPFFVFFFVFLLSALTFLRERVSGTAERLLASPLSRGELVLGYVLGFLPPALIQAAITILFARYALGGPWGGVAVVLATILLALAAECLGVFVSAFARTEFEVIQFVPMVLLPQLLLAGIFWPVHELPELIQPVSLIMPLTFAVNAVRDAAIRDATVLDVAPDLLVLVGMSAAAIVLASFSVKRTVRG